MNIVIFSGGTGSTNLIKGLKQFSNYNVHITNLVNAYDDGLSTGVCRQICDVLGPSDIRKCQYIQYINSNQIIDKRIVSLFEDRFDLPGNTDAQCQFCIDLLYKMDFKEFSDVFIQAIMDFFSYAKQKIDCFPKYKNFNIANIIYSAMFKKYGYQSTIDYFKKFLNISDDVILNSYDNLTLNAVTKDGSTLSDEASIVGYNNKNDIIDKIVFLKNNEIVSSPNISAESILAIENADLILFSSGTQWSSLIPTYLTNGMKESLSKSKAKKILIMNNECDKDMIGINSIEILNILKAILPVDDITVLFNNSACEDLKYIPDFLKHYKLATMGSIGGKHDAYLLAKNIFILYFQEFLNCDNYIFDFDNTIFNKNISDDFFVKNCLLISKLSFFKSVGITTGNSFKHIYSNLCKVFGNNLKNFNCKIYADGGIVEYDNFGNVLNDFSNFYVEKYLDIYNKVLEIVDYNIKVDFRGHFNNNISCLSFGGLSDRERKILKAYLDLYFENNKLNNKCLLNGKTSVDILNKNTDKSFILNNNNNTMYIGDECDRQDGHDFNIAHKSKYYLNVNNIYDTYLFLNTLIAYCMENNK